MSGYFSTARELDGIQSVT